LAGLVAGTAPYSWDGEAPGLRDQVGHTFERLRGVGGLRGIELTALLNYVSALPPPPAATEPEPASSVERGALVFASKQAGCAECHTGVRTTDGHLHDVATRTDADRAAAFDTPSLDRISGRAPYFHDGRYATLRELLEKSAGKMGQVQPLPAQDLDALESFLRTL
jgi:cytochrome c peroxidase